MALDGPDRRRPGHLVDPGPARTRFDRWAAEWLATTARLKPKTRARYESDHRVHVLPVFAERAVGSIQQVDVRRFVAELVAGGSAPGTVFDARKVLRLVLTTAEGSGAIRGNPCTGVRVTAPPKAGMVFLLHRLGGAHPLGQLALAETGLGAQVVDELTKREVLLVPRPRLRARVTALVPDVLPAGVVGHDAASFTGFWRAHASPTLLSAGSRQRHSDTRPVCRARLAGARPDRVAGRLDRSPCARTARPLGWRTRRVLHRLELRMRGADQVV